MNLASRTPPWGYQVALLFARRKTLAAGNVDGTVSLWDSATGKNRCQSAPHRRRHDSSRVVFSPTAPDWHAPARISRSASGTWQLIVCCPRWSAIGARSPRSAFSRRTPTCIRRRRPDRPALGHGKRTGNAVLHGHNDVVLAVTFSPDGELVASTALSDRGIQLWDVQNQRMRRSFTARWATFTCIAFTGDSQTLVTGDKNGSREILGRLPASSRKRCSRHIEGWVKGLASIVLA